MLHCTSNVHHVHTFDQRGCVIIYLFLHPPCSGAANSHPQGLWCHHLTTSFFHCAGNMTPLFYADHYKCHLTISVHAKDAPDMLKTIGDAATAPWKHALTELMKCERSGAITLVEHLYPMSSFYNYNVQHSAKSWPAGDYRIGMV